MYAPTRRAFNTVTVAATSRRILALTPQRQSGIVSSAVSSTSTSAMSMSSARASNSATCNHNTMLVLGERHVRQALDPNVCLDVNRQALISLTKQTGVVPTRLALSYPNNPCKNKNKIISSSSDAQDWTLIKPAAYYPDGDGNKEVEQTVTMGLKVISLRSKNPSNSLPLAPATISLLDASSGIIKATLAGTYLTVMRTSAGPALAVHDLKPNCQHLVMFGAGAQAQCHIEMIHVALGRSVPNITIVNRTLPNANKLRGTILDQQQRQQRSAKDEGQDGDEDGDGDGITSTINTLALEDVDGVAAALSTADVICTTTNTTSPLWDGFSTVQSLKPGCLITSIGSYTPDMCEIPSDVVDKCHVIIDTPETLAVGDLKHLKKKDGVSLLDDDHIDLAGDVFENPKRVLNQFDNDESFDGNDGKEYIFYKAVGTAIQDVLTAKAVVENAQQLGLGQDVDMS